jgi:hypothetical protein
VADAVLSRKLHARDLLEAGINTGPDGLGKMMFAHEFLPHDARIIHSPDCWRNAYEIS